MVDLVAVSFLAFVDFVAFSSAVLVDFFAAGSFATFSFTVLFVPTVFVACFKISSLAVGVKTSSSIKDISGISVEIS